MLDENLLQKVLNRASALARGFEVELVASSKREGLTRFGNNTVSQHIESENTEWVIRVQKGKRQGRASCNQTDNPTLKRTVEKAVQIAESQKFETDHLPLLNPQRYRPINHFVDRTIKLSPAEKVERVREAVALCRRKKLTAAGIFSNGQEATGVANTKGLSAFGAYTTASFSLTAMTKDSSGWAEATSRDSSQIDILALTHTAADKALKSRKPKSLPPGRYTVVLEPAAVAELLLFMSWEAFGALPYQEGRSFLSGKIGKGIMNESVTIKDDAYHPQTIATPFDFEGVPRKPVSLIEKGVGRGVVYDRLTAGKDGVQSTGHSLPQPNSYGPLPFNLIMSGGDSSIEEMVACTERGLLITHFHYTNLIDPTPLTITGMTRNGTFLIEKGRVRRPVKNFRFNESLVESFNRIEAIGRETVYASSFWGSGIIAPALKIREFNFSSATTF